MAAQQQPLRQRPPVPELDVSAPRSMRRAGKWTALLLTAFAAGLAYLGWRLISQSAFYMAKSGQATYGKVTDRTGDVLFDGSQPLSNYEWGHFADVGNLIGDTSGQMSNTIVSRNLSDLVNYSFTYGSSGEGAVLETTLLHSANIAVNNAYGAKNGTTIAYNWKTGETYVCVSRPCVDIAQGYANIAEMPEGSLLCKAFYPTVPGSTTRNSQPPWRRWHPARTSTARRRFPDSSWTILPRPRRRCHATPSFSSPARSARSNTSTTPNAAAPATCCWNAP